MTSGALPIRGTAAQVRVAQILAGASVTACPAVTVAVAQTARLALPASVTVAAEVCVSINARSIVLARVWFTLVFI